MPRYVLEPGYLKHPDWLTSSHKHRCRVTAPDEKLAREFADAAFLIDTYRQPDMSIPITPWTNPELVKVAEITDEEIGTSYSPLVEIPDFENAGRTLGAWGDLDEVADIGTGAPWKDYPRSEYLEQAVSLLERNGYEVTSAGEYTGSRFFDGDKVVATPNTLNSELLGSDSFPKPIRGSGTIPPDLHYTYEAEGFNSSSGRGLDEQDQLAAMDLNEESGIKDLMDGGEDTEPEQQDAVIEAGAGTLAVEGGAATVIATGSDITKRVLANRQFLVTQSSVLLHFFERMGLPGEGNEGEVQPLVLDDDEELKDLLRTLIAELRTFNALLQQDRPKQENVSKVTGALGEAGKNWLEKFTSSNGTRTGELVSGVVATLLVSAGVLDPAYPLLFFGGKAAGEVAKKLKE